MNDKRYFHFGRRGKEIHVTNVVTLRTAYFPCGLFKFLYQLTEMERPEDIDKVCKRCRWLYEQDELSYYLV